ncbi:MAG: hypothetical protein ACLTMP_11745 [Eggerthella lenta]
MNDDEFAVALTVADMDYGLICIVMTSAGHVAYGQRDRRSDGALQAPPPRPRA